MVGADTFAQMKPTAYFINTSRGRMVDEDALYAALTKGVIAGAGLDVHYEEPRPTPDPFAGLAQRHHDAASGRRFAQGHPRGDRGGSGQLPRRAGRQPIKYQVLAHDPEKWEPVFGQDHAH